MTSSQDNIQAGTQGCTTFHIFPLLPLELRKQVWEATYEPRVVEPLREILDHECQSPASDEPRRYRDCCHDVRTRHSHAILSDWEMFRDFFHTTGAEQPQPGDRELFPTITTTKTKPPVTLWVSKESRATTLMAYELCWGLDGGETHVWFNFDLDTLYLPGEAVWLQHMKNDLIRLQTALIVGRKYINIGFDDDYSLGPLPPPPLRAPCMFQIPREAQYTHIRPGHQPDDRYAVISKMTKTFPALNRIIYLQKFYDYTDEEPDRYTRDPPVTDLIKAHYNVHDGLFRMKPARKEEANAITRLCHSAAHNYEIAVQACFSWEIVLERAAHEHGDCSEMSQQARDAVIKFGTHAATHMDYINQFADAKEGIAHWIGQEWLLAMHIDSRDIVDMVPYPTNNHLKYEVDENKNVE